MTDFLQSLGVSLEQLVAAIKQNMPFVFLLIGIVLLVNLINWTLLGKRLNIFGILPRKLIGLPGIACAPFLHGGFNHFFFNAIPFFMMSVLILLGGKEHFYKVSLLIILLSGSAVWLLARRAYHIGASGLVMGYWAYLIANAYSNPTMTSFVIAAVTLYYFGSLILNLFPSGVEVSWESHVFGFAAGLVAAYYLPLI